MINRHKTSRVLVLCGIFALLGIVSCSSDPDEPVPPALLDEFADQPGIPGVSYGPRLRRIAVDEGSDGSVDKRFWLKYDGQGFLINEYIDERPFGNIDDELSYTYENDLLVSSTFDSGNDGLIEEYGTFTYDSNSVLLNRQFTLEPGGPIAYNVDYQQDASGQIIAALTDFEGDGLVDEIGTYSYYLDDRLSQIQFDRGLDGTIDVELFYEHGSGGRVLSRTRKLADGSPGDYWRFFYVTAICHPASNHQPLRNACPFSP